VNEILGKTARDTMNGFEGTCTARVEYVTGCIYLLLEGMDADGNPIEHWTDERRIEHGRREREQERAVFPDPEPYRYQSMGQGEILPNPPHPLVPSIPQPSPSKVLERIGK
jgi:hypothetical protein